jgi:hypothetical protein
VSAEPGAGQSVIPFGGSTLGYTNDYIELAGNIKTYTEQNIDTNLRTRIAQEFSSADCIVFLGFAYHAQNVALLKPAEPIERQPIFGTALGFSNHDAAVIRSGLEGMSQGRGVAEASIATWITIDTDATCAKLFDDYGKSIAGA